MCRIFDVYFINVLLLMFTLSNTHNLSNCNYIITSLKFIHSDKSLLHLSVTTDGRAVQNVQIYILIQPDRII